MGLVSMGDLVLLLMSVNVVFVKLEVLDSDYWLVTTYEWIWMTVGTSGL